jgi:hypothetical protein
MTDVDIAAWEQVVMITYRLMCSCGLTSSEAHWFAICFELKRYRIDD